MPKPTWLLSSLPGADTLKRSLKVADKIRFNARNKKRRLHLLSLHDCFSILQFLVGFVNWNLLRMGPTIKLWRPSRRLSGEFWGDSRF